MKKNTERTQVVKQNIFENIESLLEHSDLENITFAKIAKKCGCQPNSISYYFDGKMDMLLQFTQYLLDKNDFSFLAPDLTPDCSSSVESFCQAIDNVFDIFKRKTNIRLLSNYFLITNASLSAKFSSSLQYFSKMETEAIWKMIEFYRGGGILCETRLRASYAELCFQYNAQSLLPIFKMPLWDAELTVPDAKEHLKVSFLKDGLYTPSESKASAIFPLSLSKGVYLADNRYINGNPVDGLRKNIFEAIETLLDKGDLNGITFTNLAQLCYCEPSSIAYYFKDKMDMLLQFTQYYLEISLSHEHIPIAVSKESATPESFCHFIDCTLADTLHFPPTLFWINYIIVCNSSTISEFYEYMEYSLRRKINQYWEIIDCYRSNELLQEEHLTETFLDFCFTLDSLSMMHIFQVPVIDQEFLLKSIRKRFKIAFLNPKHLPLAV